jgi:hypothetical protein
MDKYQVITIDYQGIGISKEELSKLFSRDSAFSFSLPLHAEEN